MLAKTFYAQSGGLAVNSEHIYWSNGETETIGRATLAGGSIENSFIKAGPYVNAIAIDATHIYWANYTLGTIGRATLAGGSIEPEWIKGCSGPNGLVVTATNIYWINQITRTIGTRALAPTTTTLTVDMLNRTIVGPNGESLYSQLNLSETEWWGLGPGTSSIIELLSETAEEMSLEVQWRNAWI
jgi:hypothetical protein